MAAPRLRFLVNGLLVLALLGAIAITVLGWHELPGAAVWGRLLIGAGLTGVLAIGIMFLLPLELRANLTLTGSVSILSLWVASWVLYEPPRTALERSFRQLQAAARDAGLPFDSRTPLEVIEDLRRDGVDAYPPLSAWSLFSGRTNDDTAGSRTMSDGLEILPLAGVSNATTVVCNETGEYLIVQTDRYGFNNPDHVYAADSSLLLLGDSYTFGYCVPPGDDLASHLRSRGLDVVNLGYPGTGPLIQLAQLREYGQLVRPAAILWIYFHGNDLRNLVEEHSEPELRRYLSPEHRQDLAARQHDIDAFWREHLDWPAIRAQAAARSSVSLRDVVLLQPLRARLGSGRISADRRRVSLDSVFEYFDETLDLLIAEAEKLDAPLYFVFLPTNDPFIGGTPSRREEVLAAVQERGLPIIDFEARLFETPDPLEYFPFRLNTHYSRAGYQLLAEQIIENLMPGATDAAISRPDAQLETRNGR